MKNFSKYIALIVFLIFPNFGLATTITNSFEQTSGTYSWDDAVINCQSKGDGWDLVTANSNWSDVVAFGKSGYIKDTPSTITSHKCAAELTWPEDWKGAVFLASSNCVGDVPKNTTRYGICYGPECTHVSSYDSWTSCNALTGEQSGFDPIFSSVNGLTCTDADLFRTCGICNTATESVATSVAPTDLCAFGTDTLPTIVGNEWVWSCNGGEATDTVDDASCSAPYIPAPVVDLRALTSTIINLDSGSENVELEWEITNSAMSCGAECSCFGTSSVPVVGWMGPRTSPNGNGVFSIAVSNPKLTLTCTNSTGGSGFDSIDITTHCTPLDTLGDCDKSCGDGWRSCTHRDNNCDTSVCASVVCNLGGCPITSEWKEIQP